MHERLLAMGYPAILTKEPGGTAIGEVVRGLLLDFRHAEMQPITEILLFAAARAQHVAERIQPCLDQGGIVVCDRFTDSTYAYQGSGLGHDVQELQTITRIATGGLTPDLTIFLDLAVAAGLQRKRVAVGLPAIVEQSPPAQIDSDTVEWNRLDARDILFHERVSAGYHTLIDAEPWRWRSFDATLDRDTLATRIWQLVEPRLARSTALQGVDS